VSIFKLTVASASDPKLVAARNGVKRLRTVRTPRRRRCVPPSGLQRRAPRPEGAPRPLTRARARARAPAAAPTPAAV
jgi:hypothetical protein